MQQWALSEPNVPKSAVTSLLRVLKLYHEDLPITYSTLLPKPELTYSDMCGGTYVLLENWIEGLKNTLKREVLSEQTLKMARSPIIY